MGPKRLEDDMTSRPLNVCLEGLMVSSRWYLGHVKSFISSGVRGF